MNMKSIKNKLVVNFMAIVITIVILLEFLFVILLRNHYYDNTAILLTNQLKMSTDFYSKYCADIPLKENVVSNVDSFWNRTNAQVEIFDNEGNLLMDSLSIGSEKISNDSVDIKKALTGEPARWIGKVSYDNNKVMAVSYPIKSGDKVVGVLRYITSLSEINNTLNSIILLFIIIGIVVIAIGAVLSYFLADGVVNPVKELTEVAEHFAEGNLGIRSKNKSKDEFGKLSSTFNLMADELAERDRLKSEFISSVSHELRTPLTAIKGWIITLNNKDTDKDMLKLGFDIIEKETDRLTNMVEELLDFSRLTSGKTQLRKAVTDFDEVVNYIRDYLTPRANRENIDFQVVSMQKMPSILIDSDRIKQVLLNVIDNAIKFNNSGGYVLVNVAIKKNYLVVVVEDNGCGISEEELPRVKEKFYKGKNSKSQNGIGLSICDEIIKLHDGTFDIQSELGKGTKVIISIPIVIDEGELYEENK